MGSETLRSPCYILSDESSIPFYSTRKGIIRDCDKIVNKISIKPTLITEGRTKSATILLNITFLPLSGCR